MAAKLHMSLNVVDVELSTRWYEVFFDQPPHKRRPGYANFDVANPPLKLALQELPKRDKVRDTQPLRVMSNPPITDDGALNHLGILVGSSQEVAAVKNRFEATGLITFSEENVECCYAMQDKIWVRDPDGNAWEVYTILDDHTEDEPCCEERSGQEGCCS